MKGGHQWRALPAERNVFAHLIDLATREIVTATPQLEANAIFRMKGEKI